MLSMAQARELVVKKINQPNPFWDSQPELMVVDERTIERNWGWVFYYKATNELPAQLADVASPPFLVKRSDGEIVITSSEKMLNDTMRSLDEQFID